MPITTTRKKAQGQRRRRGNALAFIIGVFAVFIFLGAGVIWLASAPANDPTVTAIGGPFRLTEGDGKTVTDLDFRGKYLLIYFGYTVCPDVCPTTLQSVAKAVDLLGTKADQLQPLLITVDPRRDTPSVIAQYTAAFSPRLIGLSGTPDEIAKVEKAYHIYAAIHRTGPDPDDYTVDHSSVLYLMGPDGRFITQLRADASGPEIASAILKHLS